MFKIFASAIENMGLDVNAVVCVILCVPSHQVNNVTAVKRSLCISTWHVTRKRFLAETLLQLFAS